MSLGSLAFIPAPPFDTIGPFRLYGLMIALGVLASVALAEGVGLRGATTPSRFRALRCGRFPPA